MDVPQHLLPKKKKELSKGTGSHASGVGLLEAAWRTAVTLRSQLIFFISLTSRSDSSQRKVVKSALKANRFKVEVG